MRGAATFALGVGLRAAAIAALVLTAFGPVARLHLWATDAALLAIAGMILVDLARRALAADRMLALWLDGLAAGEVERPARAAAGFPMTFAAVHRASRALGAERAAGRRRLDAREALLDTVASALIVLAPDGGVELANRAARRLAGGPAARLADIRALPSEVADRLAALPPGGREVVKLRDGQRMLAAVAGFSTPEGTRRLISLHGYSGQLDAVEIEAWRDLVRILAHEMMNSLTPIASLAESLQGLVADAPEDPAARAEACAVIDVIARRSLGLMSFVERYRQMIDLPEPVIQSVQAADLADRLDRLTRAMRKNAGVAFEARIDPPDLIVSADPDLLEQALLNLVKNAVDAAIGSASPQVELSCRRTEAGGVALLVADNGSGLPEDVEMLFVPFYSTKSHGSGVGLSLARQIAVAHRGQIVARANSPQGAIVGMLLP